MPKILIGLLFSFIVLGLLLELGVLLIFGEQPKFPRHVIGADFGIRINVPNAHYRHKSPDMTTWFQINSQGMRANRDYPYEKPAGTKRIVSLGDSFTIGYEVQFEQSFSSIVQSLLREKGINVEVLNTGVSGFSTAEECVYLERELLKYDPDLVLVSFYGNDLIDSIRSNLFRLQDGLLTGGDGDYVPMGSLANFLNTNSVFSFLSGYSNAFVLIKEKANLFLKRKIVEQNRRVLEDASEQGDSRLADRYPNMLCAQIFKRLLSTTRKQGIPLVIHSIPSLRSKPLRLVEVFPTEEFGANNDGCYLYYAKKDLKLHLGSKLLYHRRSHGHWTPFAHKVAGKGIAALILSNALLSR